MAPVAEPLLFGHTESSDTLAARGKREQSPETGPELIEDAKDDSREEEEEPTMGGDAATLVLDIDKQ